MVDTMIETIPLAVVVADGSPIGITELEVVYDGTAPPKGLFAALVEIGWSPAVASPPPRAAIDWSAPDVQRGTAYTIRSYRATSRITPIRGAADEGMVESAMAVAAAHGAEIPEGFSGAAMTEAAPPVASRGSVDTIIGAVVPTARMGDVTRALGASVVLLQRVETTVTTTNTYRGQTCESQVPAVRLSLCVGSDALDEVMNLLHRAAASTPEVHRIPT